MKHEHCGKPMAPVFGNHGLRRLKAWICEECAEFLPPQDERESWLTPSKWQAENVVEVVDYRARNQRNL